MKKTTIKRSIEINAPKEKVWRAIAAIGDISHASPGVLRSKLTSEKTEGIGATRHCDFVMMGASAEERVTKWKEGASFKIEAYELKKMPGMKGMEAEFSITGTGNKTLLRGDLHYRMQGILFGLINGMMMKKMNIRAWNGLLAGYKRYIETGETVTKDTPLDFEAVKEVVEKKT